MRFALVLAMLAVCLAFVKSDADSCFEQPAVIPFGGICNGGINCQFGSYCSISSVCTVNEKVGNECSDYKTCEIGSTCKGIGYDPGFKMYCVLNAHPGQDCTTDGDSFVPSCGSGLSCNGEVCIGGEVGDSCWKNEDCLSNICDDATRTCSPLADGKTCLSTGACNLGSVCDQSSGVEANYKCKTLKTSGNCLLDSECAFGYGCILGKATDSTHKCTALNTKEPGTYCESGRECTSKRCINGYCATKNVEFCTNDDECATDQRCNCNGKVLYDGYFGIGKCVDFPCAKLQADAESCINDHCHNTRYFNGSCALNNCKTQVDQFQICSDASGLIASLFSVALATFFVSFFSKRI